MKCTFVPVANEDIANKFYTDGVIANLVNSAPASLDTLKELAKAMGNDANFQQRLLIHWLVKHRCQGLII
jgi:hypothetical protein